MMLKIIKLKKSFRDNTVLNDLDLIVNEGSIFGLVGINGAGKSTLLRLIAGVYEADQGAILLNGKDTLRDPECRADIAFVPDEAYFPIGSTIGSMKLLYQSMYRFSEERFAKYLKLFELDEKMSVNNLSKGMKRRVSLLFALSVRPKLLLLDEAYDGLEPLARLRFKKVLTELIEDDGLTVIISSHNLRELEDICDTFGILDGGKIVSYGDLLESRDLINKYQLAFTDEKAKEDFSEFEILHYEQEGRVIRAVIRGDAETVKEKLTAMNPVLLDILPVSFEELFIYELESRGEIHA